MGADGATAAVDVVVIGGGLAGLTAARGLAAGGAQVRVVEARPRVGGRMMTVTPPAVDAGWFDLGATWYWNGQPRIRALAADVGVRVFPQFNEGRALHEERDGTLLQAEVPDPAFRFAGGAQQVCERMAEALPAGTVLTSTAVTAVSHRRASLVVETLGAGAGRATLEARHAVVAVPPRLALQNIAFDPPLPPELVAVMEATATWMGDALKGIAVYESRFWEAAGLSGAAFSHRGPLHEVFDASTDDGSVAALWGFVDPAPHFRDMAAEERVPMVLDQLGRLFGPQAAEPEHYFERDWSGDPNTAEVERLQSEPLDYGHPAFTMPLMDGRLVWAGTETVAEGGGHMEGAVVSGQRAAGAVLAAI